MRLRRDNSHLSIDEQIKKLQREIKACIIVTIVYVIVIIPLSIVLILYTPAWELGGGFLITLPFTIWLSGFRQTKDAKEKIKELEEQKRNEEQNEQKEQN